MAADCPAPEPAKIAETRMRTDRDAFLLSQNSRADHNVGIAGVPAAGDVGGSDDVEHRRIVTHRPGPEAFAHVAVEIDAHGDLSTVSSQSPPSGGPGPMNTRPFSMITDRVHGFA